MTDNQRDLKVCITGELSCTRVVYKTVLKNNRIELVDFISDEVDYLICDDIHSTSDKADQARKLQIPLIDEQEARDMWSLNI